MGHMHNNDGDASPASIGPVTNVRKRVVMESMTSDE